MAPALLWRCRDRLIDCSARPLVMGVLNVTPDSFSDGGRYLDSERAVERGLEIASEGADIIDVGGESSRPGAVPVSAEEELRRVKPVIEELARRTDRLISIDTSKAAVAEAALAAGAHIINDISALRGDARMAALARETGAGVVLMHMQGTPQTMQIDPRYEDVVREVSDFLSERIDAACRAGINWECLAIDPGIGFGKTVEHNVALLAHLSRLTAMGRPVLVGVSRKRFLGALTGRDVHDRLLPSLAALAFSVAQGAHILRVHDVKESCETARLVAILRSGRVPPK
ncbi:MAG: dihydropteroate synthase [Kiritimatiellae bacterium]|nr:dihydropteroate synthase [Kiritimatiellia bacterium]MDW8457995.1 dihydropteroate synthase [Verrucomicrobiota bacterium]